MIRNMQGTFERAQRSKEMIERIKQALRDKRIVYLCTHTRMIKCTSKHIDLFKWSLSGAYFKKDCINYVGVKII